MLLFQFLRFSYISRKMPKRENLPFGDQGLKIMRSFYRIYQEKYGFEDYCWVISRYYGDKMEVICLSFTITPYFRSIS